MITLSRGGGYQQRLRKDSIGQKSTQHQFPRSLAPGDADLMPLLLLGFSEDLWGPGYSSEQLPIVLTSDMLTMFQIASESLNTSFLQHRSHDRKYYKDSSIHTHTHIYTHKITHVRNIEHKLICLQLNT